MKKFLLAVNLLLLVAAIVLTTRLSGEAAAPPVRARDGQATTDADVARPVASFPLPWSPVDANRALLIAAESLFSEERTYVEPEETETPGDEEEEAGPSPVKFEVTSIIKLGKHGAASLVVHDQPPPGAKAQPGAKAEKRKGDNKGIFALGEEVFDTGFLVTEITGTSVLLEHRENRDWSEEVQLDFANDWAKARRAKGAQAEKEKLAAERDELERLQEAGQPADDAKGGEAEKAGEKQGKELDDRQRAIEAAQKGRENMKELRERIRNKILQARGNRGGGDAAEGDDAQNQTPAQPLIDDKRPPRNRPKPPGVPGR